MRHNALSLTFNWDHSLVPTLHTALWSYDNTFFILLHSSLNSENVLVAVEFFQETNIVSCSEQR